MKSTRQLSSDLVGWQVVGSYPVAIDMLGLSDTEPGPDDEVWKRVAADALFGTQRLLDEVVHELRLVHPCFFAVLRQQRFSGGAQTNG